MPFQVSVPRRRRDGGAMLLAVLFMMAMMVMVAMTVAPAMVMQMKRDREEEMIHRGTEYARAVRKYYRKFGRYPANIEQLQNTNEMKFLRRKYKDPLVPDGEWRVIHYADIAALIGLPGQLGVIGGRPNGGSRLGANGQATDPSQAAQQLLQQGAAGANLSATAGQQIGSLSGSADSGTSQAQTTSGDASQNTANGGANQSVGPQGPMGGGAAAQNATGQGAAGGGSAQNVPGQGGNNNTIFGNTVVGGQTFGGGAIVGVASKSKDQTIRIFNKKKTYDEWVFIYSPMMEMAGGALLRGPFNGQTLTNNTQIGIPASQINQNQPQQGAPGAPLPPGGLNPQQNQQLTPGGQFPPDQTQPPPQ